LKSPFFTNVVFWLNVAGKGFPPGVSDHGFWKPPDGAGSDSELPHGGAFAESMYKTVGMKV